MGSFTSPRRKSMSIVIPVHSLYSWLASPVQSSSSSSVHRWEYDETHENWNLPKFTSILKHHRACTLSTQLGTGHNLKTKTKTKIKEHKKYSYLKLSLFICQFIFTCNNFSQFLVHLLLGNLIKQTVCQYSMCSMDLFTIIIIIL